ncbi:Uncharacterised protein [Serratia entomophila]|nr:hypothetical protein 294p2_00041 [Serratia marcescens]CAI1935350.1 Uncharacterised protein [Serratia entomophila]CAI1973661.1 Uncharacterised protein [Serratia entomophila]
MCGRGVAFWAVEKRALQGGGGGSVHAAACVCVLWWFWSGFVVVGASPWSVWFVPAIYVLSPLYPGAVAFPLSRKRMKYM